MKGSSINRGIEKKAIMVAINWPVSTLPINLLVCRVSKILPNNPQKPKSKIEVIGPIITKSKKGSKENPDSLSPTSTNSKASLRQHTNRVITAALPMTNRENLIFF